MCDLYANLKLHVLISCMHVFTELQVLKMIPRITFLCINFTFIYKCLCEKVTEKGKNVSPTIKVYCRRFLRRTIQIRPCTVHVLLLLLFLAI